MKKVLYPGSFDPITKGHMNVINQATNLFDEVVIAIMQNPAKKNQFFTPEERQALINEIYQNNTQVKVIVGKGAAVNLAIEENCVALLRGLRGVTDFDYEIQLSMINRQISNNKINTVCLFSESNYQYISSSVVREVFSLNEDITSYVHPTVAKAMTKKYPK